MDHPFEGQIIAHRGLASLSGEFVENSISSFVYCIEKKIPLEIDVQYHPQVGYLVFHDESLVRMFGYKAALSDCSNEFLRLLRYNDGHAIIDLKSFLKLIGGRVPVLLEVKARKNTNLKTLQRMCNDLKLLMDSYRGDLWVQSFSSPFLSVCRLLRVNNPIGQLITNWDDVDSLGSTQKLILKSNILNFINKVDFLSVNKSLLNRSMTSLYKNILRKPILTWTIKENHYDFISRGLANGVIGEGF